MKELVLPGRFEVGGPRNTIKGRGDDQLQLVVEVMAGLHRPASGHDHMHGDEST